MTILKYIWAINLYAYIFDQRSAYIYATAIGLYELYMNRQKASDRIFEPAITLPSNRVLYSAYDITEQYELCIDYLPIIRNNRIVHSS